MKCNKGGKSGTRKAGSPDSLQSENPGTREKRKSEREKEGAEHKDEPKNKRGEERANQKEGGWREALVALARLWPEKPEAKGKGEKGVR